jgi:hypothetical protein
MSVLQAIQPARVRHDWGATLLVAVAPHLALVLVACTLRAATLSIVLLAIFNITLCLVVAAVAKRPLIFVGVSTFLALIGWTVVMTNVASVKIENLTPPQTSETSNPNIPHSQP